MKMKHIIAFVCLSMAADFAQAITEVDGQLSQAAVANVPTTTESDPLISSLEKIVNKVKSMKDRVEKTLNETATTDVLEKSHHDFLIARGYTFTFGIGYHKLYLSELTWTEALHRCRKEKAHLAVIDSVAERKALGDLIKNRLTSLPGIHSLRAYVGIHDYCKNGSWISIFFDVLDNAEYLQWREGSSHYASYTKGSKVSSGPNCAVVDDEEYLSDVKCAKKQPFICEIESP